MNSPLLDGVPLLGQGYVTVKREHLEWLKDLFVFGYRHLHYQDQSNAAAFFQPPQDRPLTAAFGIGGEALVNYLEGKGAEVVLPFETEGSPDGPAE